MDAAQIQSALDDVFDQSIVFHSFTDYMRDYEIITYATAAPRTGIPPAYDRYVFQHTVEVQITTSLSAETWGRSLDDRLVDFETGKDLDGHVWGVKWQLLYPGAKVVPDSPRARHWANAIGIAFHEVRIETNVFNISLVFSDLAISKAEDGYAPFIVGGENHYVPPTPLSPDS